MKCVTSSLSTATCHLSIGQQPQLHKLPLLTSHYAIGLLAKTKITLQINKTDIADSKKNRPCGRFSENKPAAQAAGADPSLSKSTNRKSHPFSKMTVTFEQLMRF